MTDKVINLVVDKKIESAKPFCQLGISMDARVKHHDEEVVLVKTIIGIGGQKFVNHFLVEAPRP